MPDTYSFPHGFLFGASTSAFQVEGNTPPTQWGLWTTDHAKRLAAETSADKDYSNGSPTPIWGQISAQAKNPANYLPGIAADHFNRYPEDMRLASHEIGLNAYRFSLEWARIEPTPGEFNPEAIDHYREMIDIALSLGLEPFVGLWHWTEPLWFTRLGGWTNPLSVELFGAYAKFVAAKLGIDARFWTTINEPEVYVGASYMQAVWPPQQKQALPFGGVASKVLDRLAEAHRVAAKWLKHYNPSAQVGAAINNVCFEADGGPLWPRNLLYKKAAQKLFNGNFRDKIADTSDWLGLNYYFRHRMGNWSPLAPNNTAAAGRKSDMGWELFPQGHEIVLNSLKHYNKPIYITESGLADRNDDKRADYIRTSLHSIGKAIANGVDVRGYLHWSLLDNFEWDKGFWPEFGLIHVDRSTPELHRIVRPSAYEYRKIIEARAA